MKQSNPNLSMQTADTHVLVVGAGMAGLSAARVLAERGYRVLVLEAQNRMGGRIFTKRVGGEVIELGAEFVHGRPPELVALIEEAGLTLVERTGSWVRNVGGRLVADGSEEEEHESAGAKDPFSLLEELEDWVEPDMTFAAFIEARNLSADLRESVVGYVEGFNAADHRLISVAGLGLQQKAEDAIEGDRSFHMDGGYDQLPAFLAAKIEERGGEIRMDTRVDRIEWQSNQVVAITNQGTFSASKVIVALPLGVLQRDGIRFEPQPPESYRRVLSPNGPIRMGSAMRFTMIFREPFWKGLQPAPELQHLSFLVSHQTIPSVWWTTHPEAGKTLTGWIGGPRSATLAGLSAESLAERGCDVLAGLFHLDVEYIRALVTGCLAHDWEADVHSFGAYSYIAKGGLYAPSLLAEPVANTLYFAGEHTTTDGHWGTVHAAHSSGLRAAAQINKHFAEASIDLVSATLLSPSI